MIGIGVDPTPDAGVALPGASGVDIFEVSSRKDGTMREESQRMLALMMMGSEGDPRRFFDISWRLLMVNTTMTYHGKTVLKKPLFS